MTQITVEELSALINNSQQKATETMQELGIDDSTLESVLSAVGGSASPNREVNVCGVGKFKKYPPKQFKQLSESEDGKVAVVVETRDWQMEKGKKNRSGTSTKIHVRTKYVDREGDIVYGYDLASFPCESFSSIVSLLNVALKQL